MDATAAYQSIALQDIKTSPHQARKSFDEEAIQGLAESIKQEGLIQPVTVRKVGETFELISGERRLRAAKLLGWEQIEARIIQTVSEADAAAKGLVENIQREDLNPIEEAEGLNELIQLDPSHWTQDKAAAVIGKPRVYVTKSLLLLELPEEIKENVRQRTLSREHGIELMRIHNAKDQKRMAAKVGKKGLSVKETRLAIDRLLGQPASSHTPSLSRSPIPDPLAKDWDDVHAKLMEGGDAFWEVKYGSHKLSTKDSMDGWFFFVKPQVGEGEMKPGLARWFRQMAQALEGGKVEDSFAGLMEAQQAAEKGIADSFGAVRVPRTAAEKAELKAIALRGGPKDVYAWIYGKDSPLAQGMPAGWNEFSDTPEDGLEQILGAAYNNAKD